MNNLIKIIEEDIKLFNTAFERTRDCGGFLWVNNNLSILNIEYIKSRHLSSLIALLEGVGKEIEGMKIKEKGTVRLDYTNGKKYEVEVEVESDRQIFYNQALSDLHQLLQETISRIK